MFDTIYEGYIADDPVDIGDIAIDLEEPARYVSTRFLNMSKFTEKRIKNISSEVKNSLELYYNMNLIISFLILSSTVVVLWLIGRYIVNSIRYIDNRISENSKNLQLNRPIEFENGDELGQICSNINTLMYTIQQALLKAKNLQLNRLPK